ncbi:HD-GYP domain-containing protein [Alteromonas sp. A079]|uniref:HD-GYP domain-containing protein n=1 Tax=Alteromonas sp. A079 TaxID=3410268 RepID=UPI003BA0D205
MLKPVSIDALKPGMYVNKVLAQTGQLRMRSKGVVKTAGVIESLKQKGITLVEVDASKSSVPIDAPSPPAAPPSVSPVVEKESKPVTRESINEANDLYQDAKNIQSGFLKSLKRGAIKDLSPVEELSHSIIESVFDNKDALSCLTMIKDTDSYLLEHSINCSILMGMFTQFIGYDRDATEQASLGALLMDIGMSSLPDDIRSNTNEFNDADWEIMKTHVEIGRDIVEQYGDISDLALQIIEQHHERVDGSGYPKGLEGDEISEFARIAAIIDTFDALTSNRPHQDSITPTQALKRLSDANNLDQDLVRQFIQCVGIHPVGSLVRLKSGKLGIVSQQNKADAVSPIVMTFYSVKSNHFNEVKRIDLSKMDDEIVSGVRPDEFNLNLPKFFQEVFVHQVPN